VISSHHAPPAHRTHRRAPRRAVRNATHDVPVLPPCLSTLLHRNTPRARVPSFTRLVSMLTSSARPVLASPALARSFPRRRPDTQSPRTFRPRRLTRVRPANGVVVAASESDNDAAPSSDVAPSDTTPKGVSPENLMAYEGNSGSYAWTVPRTRPDRSSVSIPRACHRAFRVTPNSSNPNPPHPPT
jgi:hypothetical protein